MNTDKNEQNSKALQNDFSTKDQKKPRSSAFNEVSTKDQKSTINIEEEAGLEHDRKETMSEKD